MWRAELVPATDDLARELRMLFDLLAAHRIRPEPLVAANETGHEMAGVTADRHRHNFSSDLRRIAASAEIEGAAPTAVESIMPEA